MNTLWKIFYFFIFVLNENINTSRTERRELTFGAGGREKISREAHRTNNEYLLCLHARHTSPVLTMPGLCTSKAGVHEDGGVCGPAGEARQAKYSAERNDYAMSG